jgi:hypothetical protein
MSRRSRLNVLFMLTDGGLSHKQNLRPRPSIRIIAGGIWVEVLRLWQAPLTQKLKKSAIFMCSILRITLSRTFRVGFAINPSSLNIASCLCIFPVVQLLVLAFLRSLASIWSLSVWALVGLVWIWFLLFFLGDFVAVRLRFLLFVLSNFVVVCLHSRFLCARVLLLQSVWLMFAERRGMISMYVMVQSQTNSWRCTVHWWHRRTTGKKDENE